MKIPDTKIGITLYNFREFCKTVNGLDKTLSNLKDIGYSVVQVSGTPLSAEEIRPLLDKYKMYCCATHEGLDTYRNKFEETVKRLEILGCNFTALGYPGQDFWSKDGVIKLAEELNNIGKKFREKGIIFGYHNHSDEFEKFTDKIFLEELYNRTEPENLTAEIDTYWVQYGGGNPSTWIRKMKKRIHVLHLKDFRVFQKKQMHAEIGEGNLDWKDILNAAKYAKVRWYVVEQDEPTPGRDIFVSAEISYKNLRKLGLS